MRVRQVDNALDLFELFARYKRPLTLTIIADELGRHEKPKKPTKGSETV